MPDSDDSDAVARGQVDEPTVRELLLDRIDDHCRLLGLELDKVAKGVRATSSGAGPVVPQRHHDGVGDGRRDPAAGPRPLVRRTRTISPLRRLEAPPDGVEQQGQADRHVRRNETPPRTSGGPFRPVKATRS
jgi:hypothetical protein